MLNTKQEAETDLSSFHFKMSSENCPTDSVSLELVDTTTDYNLTGRYLYHKSLPDYQVMVMSYEKCFKIKHNLCGPNSLSFFNNKNELVVTNCEGTLLMKPENQSCG